ncbi:MAG: CapA family protein [Chloroflexi bacterium]|nr:CapA family protein [Chloroflexota bacterium]
MLYESETGDITIVLAGDIMLTRRLSVYREERFLALRELLHSGDVTFANFESSAREYEEGTPSPTGATFMTTEPSLLEEIKWLGVNLVSCANNHSYDYGEGGVLATIRNMRAKGIPFAGIGANLGEARSPAYAESRGGRVALIAATASFEEFNRAGEQRPDFRGRPGVNALGSETTLVVDGAALGELKRISSGLGFEAEKERRRHFGFFPPHELAPDKEDEIRFLGRKFVAGDSFAIKARPNERDMTGILRQVTEARRQADWVMVSLHCHEVGGRASYSARTRQELEEPAEVVVEFAHRCIQEGADLFVGHGPHMTLGVEIYQGCPIFYSLGDFILQNETVRFFPAFPYQSFGMGTEATPADYLDARSENNTKAHPGDPMYWETFCAVCRFEARKLAEVTLYPVDLGYGRPRPQRGRPLLADEAVGQKIVHRVARLSRLYGTEVALVDGRGEVGV